MRIRLLARDPQWGRRAAIAASWSVLATVLGTPSPSLAEQPINAATATSPIGLGGAHTPEEQIKDDLKTRQSSSRQPVLDAWFALPKKDLARLKRAVGLQIGFDYTMLWQKATASLSGRTEGSSGMLRMYGDWELVNRDTADRGLLSFRFEDNRGLWNSLVPDQLAGAIGYVGTTASTFSKNPVHVAGLYWEQYFMNGRAAVVSGRLDPSDFVDSLGYANEQTTFLNSASLENLTMAVPDPGFGIGGGGFFADQIYGMGLISDANGSRENIDWFPGGAELYKYVEVGWEPPKTQFTNAHIGAWQVDQRTKEGIPESHGIVVSANIAINDVFLPFIRAGWSEGRASMQNQSLGGGALYFFPEHRDLIGVSAAWSKSSDHSLRGQKTVETFYRYQFSRNVAVTFDAQVLIDPSKSPNQDMIGVFGIRLRTNID